MPITWLKNSIVLLLCLAASSGIGWLAYQSISDTYRSKLDTGITNELRFLKGDIALELTHQTDALNFLVTQVAAHGAGQQASAELKHDFVSLLDSFTLFDQARLIDLNGQERIRVERMSGKGILLPDSQLQDKSSRYYVERGLELAPDEIFVSPFDLNVEQGVIEQPVKPVIRLVQKAYDNKGRPSGIVVINLLGQPILNLLAKASQGSSAERVSLLNSDGYWLYSPKPENQWGFMYADRQGVSMSGRSPDIWKAIGEKSTARLNGDHGMYISDTIIPARMFAGNAERIFASPPQTWKVVAFYSDAFLSSQLSAYRTTIIVSSLLIGTLLGLALLAIGRMRMMSAQRVEAEVAGREQAAENKKSQALVTIAGGFAHEFNNILTVILSSSSSLRRKAQYHPEMLGNIDTIEQSGNRAARLVGHLMTFAQLDVARHSSISLSDLLHDLVRLLRHELPGNIIVKDDITPYPLYLKADPDALVSMLENLISNAVDAMADTWIPEIGLELRAEGKGWARLTLSDNGCGIPEDAKPFIFDPFFTTKERGTHPGLGLSQVYGIVHSMGGSIEVESTSETGTHITIRLPVENDQA